MKRTGIIFIGTILTVISCVLIGTSPHLGLKDYSIVILVGLSLLGISAPMIITPTLPEMTASIGLKFPEMNKIKMENATSGYFIS